MRAGNQGEGNEGEGRSPHTDKGTTNVGTNVGTVPYTDYGQESAAWYTNY